MLYIIQVLKTYLLVHKMNIWYVNIDLIRIILTLIAISSESHVSSSRINVKIVSVSFSSPFNRNQS